MLTVEPPMTSFFPPILLLILALAVPILSAQPAQVEYTTAVRLMEARRFEDALPILERLHRQDPTNYPVFDRTVTCLVELKRYPEAQAMLERRLGRRYTDIVTAAKLGEVLHIAADTARAREVWQRTLLANLGDLNAYRYLAETMANRREHRQALAVYRQARRQFGSSDLFVMEVANQHIASGDGGSGVGEFIRYAEANPLSASVVLRQILRYQDPELNDLAILELEERQARTRPHHELLIGLLMEQGYHRRAVQAAREYDPVAPQGQYPLFTLAPRLRAQNQFELAVQAYASVAARNDHPLRPDALIEVARTRLLEADHLREHDLMPDSLIRARVAEADRALETLSRDHSRHTRLIEAWILHAELGFDHLATDARSIDVRSRLDRLPGNTDALFARDYLTGREHLYHGRYAQARVAFTRANRLVQTGERAELTRYFLAYTDFLAGDIEFARLQMRALERISASVHANDAIRLRRWLAEGTEADSTGTTLRRFAQALADAARGDTLAALDILTRGLSDPAAAPMRGDWLLLATDLKRHHSPEASLRLLDEHLGSVGSDPRREQLLWTKARLLDSMRRHADADIAYLACLEAFPAGFYADTIRNRLLQTKPPTS
jgi:tetratricopeptide (TPR) repeat protein